MGKGVARLCHDGAHHVQGVGTLTWGLSESIGGSNLGVEDSGVNLSDLVLAWAWDDAALDTDGGCVSTGITGLTMKLAKWDRRTVL